MTQATAAQQAQVSAASVESAQVSVANAEKVDENTQAQVEASTASLNVSLENARKALENAKAQAATATAASQATVEADRKSLEEAEKNLAIVRTQIDRDTQSDRIAVSERGGGAPQRPDRSGQRRAEGEGRSRCLAAPGRSIKVRLEDSGRSSVTRLARARLHRRAATTTTVTWPNGKWILPRPVSRLLSSRLMSRGSPVSSQSPRRRRV